MSTSVRKKARTTFHHGDLAAALRTAAIAFISKSGVEGFSLREVARAIGVSPSATYRHYADRGALLTAVAADGFTLLAARMEAAIAAAPAGTSRNDRALEAAIAAYVAFAVAHPDHFRVMFGPYGVGGSLPEVLRLRASGQATAIDQLRALVQERIAAGHLPPGEADDAVAFVWTAAHGLASLLVDGALQSAVAKTPDALVASTTKRVLVSLSGARAKR
jgi:AcrR family transcriptional regulator